jgi:hypothetical protein
MTACGRHTTVSGPRICTTAADCQDEELCNGIERCIGGRCAPGIPPSCDDGVSCTQDRCDERVNACVHVANDAACDDGVACTADSCDLARGCLHAPDDDACDDRRFCNGVERCDATLGCSPGTPVSCAAGRSCESSTCDEATRACVLAPIDADADGHAMFPCGDDCDDSDPTVHPGAKETCNGRDDDCDGLVDEDRVVSPRIDLSDAVVGWTTFGLGLLANTDGSFAAAWPDTDCGVGANAVGQGMAVRLPDGSVPSGWTDARVGGAVEGGSPIVARPGGGYLVGANVWDPATQRAYLSVTLFPPTGTPITKSLGVQIYGNEQAAVDLVSDGTHILMLEWRGPLGLFFYPLTADGDPAGPATSRAIAPASRLAFDPGSNGFSMLVWRGTDLFAELLDASGALVGEFPIPDVKYAWGPSPSLVWAGRNYVVLWTHGAQLFTRVFDGHGAYGQVNAIDSSFDSGRGLAVSFGGEIAFFSHTGSDSYTPQVDVLLLDQSGQVKAPAIRLVGKNEAYGRKNIVAGPSGYALVELLDGVQGRCSTGTVAMRTLSCPP